MFSFFKKKDPLREHTLELLKALDLPVGQLPNLPLLDRTPMRDARMISIRAMILSVYAYLAEYPEDRPDMKELLFEGSNLSEFLTTREHELMGVAELTDADRAEMALWGESFYMLMWVLGFEDELPYPDGEGPVAELMERVPPEAEVEAFKASIQLIPEQHLREALDLYYLTSWFARREHPGLDPHVVRERRKALEWAADATLDDWDDIPLDT